MKKSPSKHSQIHLYADDTILYPVGPSPQSTAFSFKFSLTPLEESLHSLHPCLNIRKTKCILFSWRPDVAPSPMITGFDGTVSEHVYVFKYLCLSSPPSVTSKPISKLEQPSSSPFTHEIRHTLGKIAVLPILDCRDIIF